MAFMLLFYNITCLFFNPLFSLCEHRQNAAFCLQGKNWIFGIILNLFLNFFDCDIQKVIHIYIAHFGKLL